MRAYHRLARIAGVEIGIHISWYVVAILLAYSLAVGYFPAKIPGLSSGEYGILGGISALLLFACVLLHELSHALVAQWFGLKIERVFLFFFGGVSQIHENKMQPKSEAVMAAAGPLFSIVLGITCWLLAPAFSSQKAAVVVEYLGRLNLTLGFFNLLPGFPLDGGRILRAVLWKVTGRLDFATRHAAWAGKVFAGLLAGIGVVSLAFGDVGGLWLVLIGVFLFLIAESSVENMVLRHSLSMERVGAVMDKNPLAVPPHIPVSRLVSGYFLRLSQDTIPVVDNRRLVGVVCLDRVASIKQAVRGKIMVKDVMVPAAKVRPVKLDDVLLKALEGMNEQRLDLLPVMDGKQFVGVVTKNSIIHFLRLVHQPNGKE